MGDDRPPCYWDETERWPEGDSKKLVVRASAIGHPCMWELIAAAQNVDSSGAPLWMKKAFQEGHLAEPGIVRQLIEEYEVQFESHQDEGELVILMALDGTVVVMRYHPDGVGMVDLHRVLPNDFPVSYSIRVVVEIKNLSDVLWQRAVRHGVQTTIADYPWQLSGMMIKEGLPGLWVARNKGKFEKDGNGVRREVYTPDKGKLFFQYVPTPLVEFSEFEEKAQEILEGVRGEDLLTSDRRCDDAKHFPCLFRHVRPEPSESESEIELREDGSMAKKKARITWEPEGEMREKVDEVVKRLRQYKGQIAEAQEGYEREAAVLDALIPEGMEAVRTDTFEFNVANSHATRTAWDEMPQELKDELARYKTSEVTGRHTRDYKRID